MSTLGLAHHRRGRWPCARQACPPSGSSRWPRTGHPLGRDRRRVSVVEGVLPDVDLGIRTVGDSPHHDAKAPERVPHTEGWDRAVAHGRVGGGARHVEQELDLRRSEDKGNVEPRLPRSAWRSTGPFRAWCGACSGCSSSAPSLLWSSCDALCMSSFLPIARRPTRVVSDSVPTKADGSLSIPCRDIGRPLGHNISEHLRSAT